VRDGPALHLLRSDERQPNVIADHLPAYYEAFGTNPTHRVIKSLVISGHEMALVENQGTIIRDPAGLGREGQPYLTLSFACECEFRRGIGWWQWGDNEPVRRYSDFDRTCLLRLQGWSHLAQFRATYAKSLPLDEPALTIARLPVGSRPA
jgi:hypothetical protein